MAKPSPGKLIFASPWIFATAVGLLLAIILFFAVNNLQREQRLTTETLLDRGQAIIRLVEAGTRAAMMRPGMGPGMRMQMLPNGPEGDHLQQLIEQAVQEKEIIYIAVLDDRGGILAHSDPGLVGTTWPGWDQLSPSPASGSGQSGPSGQPGSSAHPDHRIRETTENPGRIFEVNAPFAPFAGRGRHRLEAAGGNQRLILVGLDMTEAEAVLAANRRQIFFISLTMLLVGIGGWLALLGAQGCRTAEKTLQYTRAFTGLLISRLPLGIIAVDRQGLITTCNEVAARLAAGGQEPIPNQPAGQVLHDQIAVFLAEPTSIREIIDQEIKLPPPSGDGEGSRNLAGPTGEPRTVTISAVPVRDRDREIIGRVLLLHDVTELKALEREAHKNERLVALGKMAAGVAHEIRNPLSSIKGLATLLGSRFPARGQEHQAAQLLVGEVERLNRSVSELLDYARPQALKRQPVSIHRLLRDSLQLVAQDAAGLNVELEFQPQGPSPVVSLDPDRITQVLLNLYLNSLQAMPAGGRLTVQTGSGPGSDTDAASSGGLEITIADTGCGIAPANLNRVTDPYFTTKPEGSGLGLALAQKIVEEHGATLSITSREGRGTSITLRFPEQNPQDKRQSGAPNPAQPELTPPPGE